MYVLMKFDSVTFSYGTRGSFLLMRLDTFFKHTDRDHRRFKSIFSAMWISFLVALLCAATSRQVDKTGTVVSICSGSFSSIYTQVLQEKY